MKKLLLLLLLFSFVSVMPSFALKIIVNDNEDRRVPSRSSGHERFIEQQFIEQQSQQYYENKTQEKSYSQGYQKVKFRTEYLPLLKEDIRYELVGTSWDYPDEEQYQQQVQQAQQAQQVQQEQQQIIAEHMEGLKYHREAADYFTKDTISAPNSLIPCGDVQ